jgi:dTDP-4-dehydrorhamnose 3,5-epimerase-like enzyme
MISSLGYQLHTFQIMGNEQGSLISLQAHDNIDFEIKRVYYIFGTQQHVVRGFHAHKRLKQMIVAVSGSCDFKLDDGETISYVSLNNPAQGLYLQNNIWREFTNFSADCVLMVLANEPYDEDEYIRDYDAFLRSVKR